MLLGMWNTPLRGLYAPEFRQNVQVTKGQLNYEIPEEWLSKGNWG